MSSGGPRPRARVGGAVAALASARRGMSSGGPRPRAHAGGAAAASARRGVSSDAVSPRNGVFMRWQKNYSRTDVEDTYDRWANTVSESADLGKFFF
jgi:hypothetical protein